MSVQILETQVIIKNEREVDVITVGIQGASGIGVPIGGTTGQVLKKISNTDYATEWASLTVAGDMLSTNNLSDVTNIATARTNLGLGNVNNTSDLNKPVGTATQTALDLKVDKNAPITGATKTKVTYDAKGLVTAGIDATTSDIADTANKRYVTDAQQTVIGNTSGINTGDQTRSSLGIAVKSIAFGGVTPANDTLYITTYAPFAGTINSVQNIQTSAGTITASIRINGTNVTGLSAIAVTSTPQDINASSANTFAIGDEITVVLSSNSSSANLRGAILITQ